MSLLSTLKKIAVGLLFVGVAFVAGDAIAQQSPEMNAVKAANEGFYKALSARDIVAMQKVWANDGEIINLGLRHKAPDVGWMRPKKSFMETFDAAPLLNASMDQPQIRINGQVAWVSGLEKGQRQAKSGEKQTISNYGTNVFVNEGGRWLMVSHQRLFKIGAASGYDHFEMVPLCYGRGGWAASASAQQFRGEV